MSVFQLQFGAALTKSILKHWALESTLHLDRCVATIAGLGYRPHRQGSSRHSLHFVRAITPSIQGSLGVNRWWTNEAGHTCIGAALCIRSSLLTDLTVSTDPWYVPPERAIPENNWAEGFEPCLTADLSHLKWATAEAPTPPAWALTDEGLHDFEKDFMTLFEAPVRSLIDDLALVRLLECVARCDQPFWVKADRPGFASFEAKLKRLRDHAGGCRGSVNAGSI